ncbi:MAG: hypothetical protein U0610_09055 [bacterium]
MTQHARVTRLARAYVSIGGAALLAALAFPTLASAAHAWFAFNVRDASTNQPLGCARFRTIHDVELVSDANGNIAFYEPGLMGQSVWFHITRQGYKGQSFPDPDGFGFSGKAFIVTEGGSATVLMTPIAGQDPGSCAPGTDETTLLGGPVPAPSARFRIRVIDAASGRGVPLVHVTSPRRTYQTDSKGWVAFHDPALMSQPVAFQIASFGYTPATASFTTTPGGSGQVALTRINVAERLYRETGGGIYRDSDLLGMAAPTAQPLLNGKVLGSDSVLSTVYQGKAFWIWGDTNFPQYPLGNFKSTGATSLLPGQGGLDPADGVDHVYFTRADGSAAEMLPSSTVPNPPGYTAFLAAWVGSLVAVPDGNGVERLFAQYSLVPGLATPLQQGWARFNDATHVFEQPVVLSGNEVVKAEGHAFDWTHGSARYVHFEPRYIGTTGLHDAPVRVPATASAIVDPRTYQAFTALAQGSSTQLVRDGDGRLVYTWKTGTPPISGDSATSAGVAPEETLYGHYAEPETLEQPLAHGAHTAWNEHRKRFVQIFTQGLGTTSLLGEVWFAEADTPMGPWVYARKVMTQDNYSFYNPNHHAFLDQQGGKLLYFEGTYTTLFTSGQTPTPRYEYNNEMMRLDLGDARLALPVPVYDLGIAAAGGTLPGNLVTKSGLRASTANRAAAFFARDRAVTGLVPVWWSDAACRPRALLAGGSPQTEPIFWALPGDTPNPPTNTVPLWEFTTNVASLPPHVYTTDAGYANPDYVRGATPLVHVWVNPMSGVTLPVTDYLGSVVADAGADVCTVATSSSGAYVSLDASQTATPNGAAVSHAWSFSGGSASGAKPSVLLPKGLSSVKLTTTAGSVTSTDYVTVYVAPCTSGCC